MTSSSTAVVLVCLAALCCDVIGFAIRHHPAKSDLSEAFRVLERQRRRINEVDYLAASHLPTRSQLPPEALAEWGQGIPVEEERAWLQDAYGLSPYEEAYGEEFVDEPDSDESPVAQAIEAPSKEELEGIFESSDEDNKSDEQDAENTEPEAEAEADETQTGDAEAAIEESEDDSVNENSDPELANLTEEEFNALMSAVTKLQKRALNDKKDKKDSTETVATPEPQPVSKEEISAVFSDSSEENDDNSKETSEPEKVNIERVEETVVTPGDGLSERDKETLSDIEKYWYWNSLLRPEDKRKKRFTKRAPPATPPNSIPLEETYVQEIQRLKDQILAMKLMAQLEDMENDALTQTLNEATLSQMEGTVSEKEFGALEQAIQLEEALQDLKNGKINDLIVQLIAANAVGEQKRGEPIWKKKKRMDETDLERSYPMFPSDKRSSKRGLVEGSYSVFPGQKRSSKRVQEQEEEKWYDRPIKRQQDEDVEQENYLDAQDAIDDLVAASLMNKAEAPEDDEDSDDDMARVPASYLSAPGTEVMPYTPKTADIPSDQCPSLQLLNDCRFADVQGLPIDEEARELCNRHDICYQCGSTIGVKQGECDSLYRGDAAILCSDDEDCVIEAELFLREMKMKHRYNTYLEQSCNNRCTADLIGL